MQTVIVEDELASQQYLKNFLEEHFPKLRVAAVADDVPGAVAAVKAFAPDIVFLDIEIKMGTGFDVLAALPDLKAEIIFTTAFNQFAIEAFKYHAIDYLLKPLEDKRMTEAIAHCISRVEQKTGSQQIAQLLQHLQQPAPPRGRIGIHTVDGIEFIDIDNILFAEAKGNYTELKLRTGAKITASRKLKEIEQSLGKDLFFRIHHSYVVNSRHIRKYHKGRGGYVTLTDNTDLPVSSARKEDFLKHFGED